MKYLNNRFKQKHVKVQNLTLIVSPSHLHSALPIVLFSQTALLRIMPQASHMILSVARFWRHA